MKVVDPSEVVALLDTPLRLKSYENERSLRRKYGIAPLIPACIAAFPRIKTWLGRATILDLLLPYARTTPPVVELAIVALRDKSRQVRCLAIGILAYSLRTDVVGALREAAQSNDSETRESAQAALDAIEHQNHHYFVDREHRGTTFWSVSDGDIAA